MLFVDDRVGSKDLLDDFTRAGLLAELTRLEAGDIAFFGRDPKGRSLNIGIELKRLDGASNDLVQSLRSGRLAGEQLPKLLGPKGHYDIAWVLIEGDWRSDQQGQIIVYKGKHKGWRPVQGRMSAVELEKQVLTLELCGGLHTRYCPTRPSSVRFISSLFHWFTDRRMDQHTSHLAQHNPSSIVPLSPFRQTVCRFPHIGLRTSAAAETRFHGSLLQAVNASVEDWAELTTLDDKGHSRRLGTKAAMDIVAFLK